MKAVGIILAGGSSKRLGELAERRSVAALPIGGCYRSIDFALSSMTNSGIRTVAVLTQYNARSLTEHLNSSKWWNFGRKNGGLYLFSPTITPGNRDWYKGTADAMYQNIDFLKKCDEEYVIISGGDCIYKMDFRKLLAYHKKVNADITIVCKEMPEEKDVSRFGVVQLDEDNRVAKFEEKPLMPVGHLISAGIYCISKALLIELLEKSAEEGRRNFAVDILFRYRKVKRIMGYRLETYWSNIADKNDYYKTNCDFLNPEIRNYFFYQEDRVLTKAADLPPAKFNKGSCVKNSMAASGCIIEGTVENSVLYKQVRVGKGTIIRNSVILNDVTIGDDVTIENCIVESSSVLKPWSHYKGEEEPLIVSAQKKERYEY